MRLLGLKRNLLVILFFILLTVVMTYPWSFQMSSLIHASADAFFVSWTLAWDVHMLQKSPLEIFNANIFYPHKNTLAYSEHLIGNAFFAWPIISLTNNPILAYNVLTFLFFVLGGYFAYLLVYYFTRNIPTSILAGVIFGFNPFRFIHFSQLHLQVAFFFPLLLLILHYLVKTQKTKYFIAFIFFFILLGYMSGQYFLIMTIVVPAFLIFYFAVFQKSFPKRKFLIKMGSSLLIIFLGVLPGAYPYFRLSQEIDYIRTYAMINAFSPTLRDYLAFSPILRPLLWEPFIFETTLYTGFTVFLLFIASLVFLIKKFSHQQKFVYTAALYFFIGFSCFLLSFGVLIRLNQNDQGIIGPYMLLYQFIPGFDMLRALGRFWVVVLLSLSVIIGIAVGQYFQRVRKRLITFGITALLLILVIIEYLWIPPFKHLPLQEAKTGNDIPVVYQWLADQKDETVILELPIEAGVNEIAKFMYYSTYHWKKLVNGYSGYFPQDYLRLEKELIQKTLPPETIEKLKALGINYLIVHRGLSDEFDQNNPFDYLATLKDLVLVRDFGNDLVYELKSEAP